METVTISALAAIVVLLLLSGFFSGSETALTAASRPRMHQLEKKGDKRAKLVNRMRDHRDRMIAAILLGNNLVNILASALATSLLITAFGEAGIVYATAAMTVLILIFGEILPKTYAFRNADQAALALAPILRIVIAVLAPISDTVQAVIRITLRMFGVDVKQDEEWAATVEELRGAIELHGRGPESRQQRAMLRSILDLADVEVEMVMRHRTDIATIDAGLPTGEIVAQALESPYTRIPLWRDEPDNIVGILHAKALLRAISEHRGELDSLSLDNIITPPWFIPETTSLLDQLQAFRRRREHFALVVDEYGSLMGVVTLEDILEEIVGDISDEHDVVPIGVRPQRDGSYLVDGSVTIRDLNRRFEWRLPDQEAATIAGLVLHEAKVIPEVGQIFMFHEFRFEIIRRRRNQITLIRISPAASDSSSDHRIEETTD
jgi:magnesium and cobalt exporter, CNNM family